MRSFIVVDEIKTSILVLRSAAGGLRVSKDG